MTKKDIKVGCLVFKYSEVIEGYYAEISNEEYVQLQIISDGDKEFPHWSLSIPFLETTTSHSPQDTAKLAYDLLVKIANTIKLGQQD